MSNPLLATSQLPYQLPDFAAIKIEHLRPAIEKGLEEESEQWRAVASNPEPPTVENTVVALDDAGQLLERAASVLATLSSAVGGPEYDALEEELAPLFAAHSDEFWLNEHLYRRYRLLAEEDDLDQESRWLIDDTVRSFELSGVALDDEAKASLREANARIAVLEAQIDSRISRQLDTIGLTGDDPAALAGLDDDALAAALRAGPAQGGGWFLPLDNFSIPSALAQLENPQTRRQLLELSLGRGLGSDPDTDVRSLIVELASLREYRAVLLGFSSHGELVISEEMAPSQTAVVELLLQIGKAAHESVNRILIEHPVQHAADWPAMEEQLRYEQLGIDAQRLRHYLPLSRVIEKGVFFAAKRLYGLSFHPRADLQGWTQDTSVWEVFDRDDEPLGLFLADFCTRAGKSGGAWMTTLVPACGRTGERPVVTNNANFPKPDDGSDPLLTWDQVITCFHEFGHALHGLLTQTQYRETEGANVSRDFVELPSQLNEMWAYHPEVLASMARHVSTGEPLPGEMAEALVRSAASLQEYATLELVAAALVDQAWHGGFDVPRPGVEDFDSFERSVLAIAGIYHPLVPPRYRSGYFAHSFSGGYDAAYYSYLWSEAMVAELEEWFAAGNNGGLNRQQGGVIESEILSRGGSRDPLESFVAVLGREPRAEAIVRRRGLAETAR